MFVTSATMNAVACSVIFHKYEVHSICSDMVELPSGYKEE